MMHLERFRYYLLYQSQKVSVSACKIFYYPGDLNTYRQKEKELRAHIAFNNRERSASVAGAILGVTLLIGQMINQYDSTLKTEPANQSISAAADPTASSVTIEEKEKELVVIPQ